MATRVYFRMEGEYRKRLYKKLDPGKNRIVKWPDLFEGGQGGRTSGRALKALSKGQEGKRWKKKLRKKNASPLPNTRGGHLPVGGEEPDSY